MEISTGSAHDVYVTEAYCHCSLYCIKVKVKVKTAHKGTGPLTSGRAASPKARPVSPVTQPAEAIAEWRASHNNQRT